MSHFVFSMQVTIPIFLLMVLGYAFKQLKIFDASFVKQMNRFVFLIPLPVMLFRDLSRQDFRSAWNGKYVLFCMGATILSILISFGFSFFVKEKENRAEFTQAAYRSSASLLGMALIQNMYGNSGMGPLMIIGTVPLYNICAVLILSLSSQYNQSAHPIRDCLMDIVKNPILIGIVCGLCWSLLKLPHPPILSKTVDSLSSLATPLGLMALGGSIQLTSLKEVIKPALGATLLKLVGFVGLFLPLAIYFGFEKSELLAILIMLGSASTVSCFVMAKNMGRKGQLSAAIILLTTLASSFTLTFWIFILRSMGLI